MNQQNSIMMMWHSNHLRSITIFNGIESIPKWDLFMAARVSHMIFIIIPHIIWSYGNLNIPLISSNLFFPHVGLCYMLIEPHLNNQIMGSDGFLYDLPIPYFPDSMNWVRIVRLVSPQRRGERAKNRPRKRMRSLWGLMRPSNHDIRLYLCWFLVI